MKYSWIRLLPIVVAGAVLIMEGFVYGVLTDRWQSPEELQAAVANLEKVPMIVGDWQGETRPPLSDKETQQAGFAGHVIRHYRHRQTGEVVSILLACGRSGPIAVHSPEICYRGSGYQTLGIKKTRLGSTKTEFFKAKFRKPSAMNPHELRILWSWNADGNWKAPSSPRFTFAGAKVLYKLYVFHELFGNDSKREEKEIGEAFLDQFVPELNRALN